MRKRTIFYSWQSENTKTKNFIWKTICKVVEDINKNNEIGQVIEADRDTAGKTGSPSIDRIIEDKIEKCDIFIADVSIIGEANDKKIVNQNVMFELGYAIAKHGSENVILPVNLDLGKTEDLPFDIAHRRILGFSMADNAVKKKFYTDLKDAILAHLKYIENKPNTVADDSGGRIEIDPDEWLAVELLSKLNIDKRIMVTRTSAGARAHTAEDAEECWKKILERMPQEEFVANLNSLVDKKVLEKSIGKNTDSYKLAKLGFNLMKDKKTK